LSALIDIRDVTKTYEMGAETIVHACRRVAGDRGGRLRRDHGPVGLGKSTLMNLIGCLDTPRPGSVQPEGARDRRDERRRARTDPQQGDRLHLPDVQPVPRADAVQNVELPLVLFGASARERRERAERRSTTVGWVRASTTGRTRCPAGQRSASAIARALVNGPSILLATSRPETSTRDRRRNPAP
jgi:putative ABC transport system ATP-binding protein